jgi:hypothetical protein
LSQTPLTCEVELTQNRANILRQLLDKVLRTSRYGDFWETLTISFHLNGAWAALKKRGADYSGNCSSF